MNRITKPLSYPSIVTALLVTCLTCLTFLACLIILPVTASAQGPPPPIPNNQYLQGVDLNSIARNMIGVNRSNVVSIDPSAIGTAFGGNVSITGTLTITGGFTPSGVILAPDGTAAAPAYSYASSTNTGWYLGASSQLNWTLGGVSYGRMLADEIQVKSTSTIAWSSSTVGAADDLVLARDAANTLAQRNSTNAQVFRVYKTYTDATHYEFGALRWNTSNNALYLLTDAGSGGGSYRSIIVSTDAGTNGWTFAAGSAPNFTPITDNAYTIGSVNLRASNVFATVGTFGTSPAASGTIRIPNNASISALNQAGNSDIGLIFATTSNQVSVGAGSAVLVGNGSSAVTLGGVGTTTITAVGTSFGITSVVSINTSGTSGTALRMAGTVFWTGFSTTSGALSGAVCMSSTGEMEADTNAGGCLVSSERFKHDIQPMPHGLDWAMQMTPVTWQWNDASHQPTMGASTAEKAAAIDPSLATFDDQGRPYSLNDRGILGMLVNSVKELKLELDLLKAKQQ